MGYSNGVITAPVGLAEVGSALGSNSTDVATLCTYSGINKAALYCPRYTVRQDIDLKSTASDNGFAYLASQIGQAPAASGYKCPAYGVWVPEIEIRNVANSTTWFNNLWTAARRNWYIPRPALGDNSFKCLHHFDGYFANAKVVSPINQAQVQVSGGKNVIQITLATPAPDGKTLSVSNLFSGWYLGAVILRGSNHERAHGMRRVTKSL